MSDPYPGTGVRRVTANADSSSDVGDMSVGQLVSQVSTDLSTLMRQELELAKVEIKEEVKKGGKAAGMFGGAGGAGYFALLFLSLAVALGLGEAIGDGLGALALGALIVGVLYAIAAGVLFLRGKQNMQDVSPTPTQTVETLKEDVQWAKTRNK